MYSVKDPFRLDQGDVSFDAPDTVKAAMRRAIDENRSHYLQTTGVPRLLELLAEKLRTAERHPDRQPRRDHGDDRRHPRRCTSSARRCSSRATKSSFRIRSGRRAWATSALARRRAGPVPAPRIARLALRSRRARVEDHAEDARDLHQLAAQSDRRRADPRRHRSASRRSPSSTASGSSPTKRTRTSSSTARSTSAPRRCPGMYERTISLYTFSKTYAMTGLRLGYVAAKDATLRDRMKKVLFYTASNVASVVQFGGDRRARRIAGLSRRVPRRAAGAAGSVLRGHPRARRRCVRAARRRRARSTRSCGSIPAGSRRGARGGVTLVGDDGVPDFEGRIGCVPGVDFGANGEGYLRFCFARGREELTGALESMGGCSAASDRTAAPNRQHWPERALPHVAAAVHADGFAGDEVGFQQKHHRVARSPLRRPSAQAASRPPRPVVPCPTCPAARRSGPAQWR